MNSTLDYSSTKKFIAIMAFGIVALGVIFLNKHDFDLTPPPEFVPRLEIERIEIAIVFALVSTKYGRNIHQYPLLTILKPSFCQFANNSFPYRFYVGYDFTDVILSDVSFQKQIEEKLLAGKCQNYNIQMHWIKCSHSGKPAWAQNDAAFAAYIDHVSHIYRINDDTKFTSHGWPETFMNTLQFYNPTNVGVVGPFHKGGNMAIMTYDFTHRTHIDIFGFHYPRLFTDWYADDWITRVYLPGRSLKLKNMTLVHTMSAGQRYRHNPSVGPNNLEVQLKQDKVTLQRYIAAAKSGFKKPNNHRVIAMSLATNDTDHIHGAIRNAQLLPIIYPGWRLRLYIWHRNHVVSSAVLRKLQILGAQLRKVHNKQLQNKPHMWPLSALSDNKLHAVLIRSVTARISAREAAAVRNWLKSGAAAHTMIDQPKHRRRPVVTELFAAQYNLLPKNLPNSLNNIIATSPDSTVEEFLAKELQGKLLAHTFLKCNLTTMKLPFPTQRESKHDVVGLSHNTFHIPNAEEVDSLRKFSVKTC